MQPLLKAALLIVHIAAGLLLALRVAIIQGSRGAARERLAQLWSRRLLDILDIRLRVEGEALQQPHITAANHVSWLDVPVLSALEPTRFISKFEVRDWPIAGWLAQAAGTFFLRRGKSSAAPLLERLVPHLRRSGSVVLFPEGTTTDGTQLRPFHSRLFAAAVESGCAVQPVTLQYGRVRGERLAPFIGDDSLASHILRLLKVPALEVRVRYGPPLYPAGSRDRLAQEAECFVRTALLPEFESVSDAAPGVDETGADVTELSSGLHLVPAHSPALAARRVAEPAQRA